MSSKEFKYKSKFRSFAKFSEVNENDSSFISNASMGIEDLTKLIPSNTCGKKHNICAAFNAAVVNLVNANDDAISTDTAIAIYKDFINQPINIEHNKNNVVGFITNAGFSSFSMEESVLLDEDAVKSEGGPFNISLSCLLWEYVDFWTVDFLKMTNDEKSYFYKSISASWEIGYNEYQIVLGSKKLSDATIITDPVEVEKYSKFLRAEGGTGYTSDGTPVYRLIIGEAKPLGCALTSNPAAAVKGVILEEVEEDEEDDKEEDSSKASIETEPNTEETSLSNNILNNLNKNDDLISQSNNNKVITIKSMEFTSREDFVTKISEASGVKSDSISDFIKAQMKDGDEKFAQLQNQAKAQEDELKLKLEELSNASAEMEKVKKDLEDMKASIAESQKQDRFSSRLESLSSKYDLDDKTRKFLAKQIIDLEDEAYEGWLAEDGEVILASKIKSTNEEKSVEEAIKTAVASTEFVPNASTSQETKSKKTSWVLGEDVTIKQ